MSVFRNSNWTVAQVPELSLHGNSVEVDIGFLSGDQHREAFIAILAKVLQDNSDTFDDGAQLFKLDALNPLPSRPFGVASLPAKLSQLDEIQLGRALYDSGNEEVVLHVQTSRRGRVVLHVRFDNPQFWIDPLAV